MELQKHFDENVLYYDKYRPTYGQRIYRDINDYAKLGKESAVIEVGCGTGQATKPFLDTGCTVYTIEIGTNLAEFTKSKYSEYKNFHIVNNSFEDYTCENSSVDLLYSATAFHWIPEDIGYSKARDVLKPGGCIALFWNTPRIDDENTELTDFIQNIYLKYNYPSNQNKDIDSDWYKEKFHYPDNCLKKYGFDKIISQIYTEYRTLSADEYIGLLHTYSDHMALPSETRDLLFGEIHETIARYGTIKIKDTIDLHMGAK